jgi:hypothetical protein
MPIIQPEFRRLIYWSDADQKLDFTAKDKLAADIEPPQPWTRPRLGSRAYQATASTQGISPPPRAGSVREVLQIRAEGGGHGRLVMFNVTDSRKGTPP